MRTAAATVTGLSNGSSATLTLGPVRSGEVWELDELVVTANKDNSTNVRVQAHAGADRVFPDSGEFRAFAVPVRAAIDGEIGAGGTLDVTVDNLSTGASADITVAVEYERQSA